MDTNSKNESNKTYAIDAGQTDTGYGPKGEYSLSDWRAKCLLNLMSGSEAFKAWQDSWSGSTSNDLKDVSFETTIGFEKFREGYKARKLKPFTLDFSDCVFDENQDFSEYIFQQNTLFTRSDIKNGKFQRCIFYAAVDFNESKFGYCADFTEAEFNNVSFTKTNFRGNYASFRRAIFKSHVTFDNVQFPGQPTKFNNLSFEHAKFEVGVHFLDCSMTCLSYFGGVQIYHGAKFTRVVFKEKCTFSGGKFIPKFELTNTGPTKYSGLGADFDDSVFESDVDFGLCIFDIPAYFIKTKFYGDAVFDEAQFNTDVRFFNAEFIGGAFFSNAKFTNEGAMRLGQMKRMAEENGQTDQALNFNALELEHKGKASDAGFWFKLFTNSYGIFSDYGRSFVRPLYCYIGLLIATFCIALAHATYFSVKDCKGINGQIFSNLNRKQIECEPVILKNGDSNGTMTGWRAAGEYMLYRAVGVLDFADSDKKTTDVANRLFGQEHEPWWMRIYGIFKAIASTALLFLAALGLRNKYRIK